MSREVMPYTISVANQEDMKSLYLSRSINYKNSPFYQENFVKSLEGDDILDLNYSSKYFVLKTKKSGTIVGSVRVTNFTKEIFPLNKAIAAQIPWEKFSFVDRLNVNPGLGNASMYLMVAAWGYCDKSTEKMVALATKKLCRRYKIAAGLDYLCVEPFEISEDLKEPVYLVGGETKKILNLVKSNNLQINSIVDKLSHLE